MFMGNPGRHDFRTDPTDDSPRETAEWRWGTWKRERLVALEAEGEARFTTVQRECEGTQMKINYETETGGWVRVGAGASAGDTAATGGSILGVRNRRSGCTGGGRVISGGELEGADGSIVVEGPAGLHPRPHGESETLLDLDLMQKRV